MEEKKLNETLREQARGFGLCDKWYDGWDRRSSEQELIDKYLKGIDFCIKHDYPTLSFIKENFNHKRLLMNGIFVDESVDTSNVQTLVLLGNSSGVSRYDGLHVGNIYLRHTSQLTVEASDSAKVFIEAWENCKLRVVATGSSKVFVYWHGGEVTKQGNVIIRDKRQ